MDLESTLCRLESVKKGKYESETNDGWESIRISLNLADQYYSMNQYFDSYCYLRQSMKLMESKSSGSHLLIFVIILKLISHKHTVLTPEDNQKLDSTSELVKKYGSLLKSVVLRFPKPR